ncbi:hypothetical protein PMAYCL1PPCAC_28146, partial [Pristionchus mayeri]
IYLHDEAKVIFLRKVKSGAARNRLECLVRAWNSPNSFSKVLEGFFIVSSAITFISNDALLS